jgi:hypothetical protein
MIVRTYLPAKWKKFVSILADISDLLPDRLIHKISRLNRRANLLERGRSG